MSDKGFQKKQRSPWPWITGIIILAGFIWFMLIYVYMPENNDNKVLPGDTSYSGPPIDTINEVREFISYAEDTNTTLSSKDYSEKGLIKLQSALSYIADRIDSTDNSIDENLDSLDHAVARIDTSSYNYLGELKPAFSDAVNAMESIQKINYPGLSDYITNLKDTTNRIEVKKSARSQLQKIRSFYKEAADMLREMKLSYAFSLNNNSY
jgi:hypothetical protein